MVWNCSIIAVALKNKAFGNESKTIGEKAERSNVGKQCIIRSDSFLGFAGKTEVSCKIVDADDEWIRICYTEKKTNK